MHLHYLTCFRLYDKVLHKVGAERASVTTIIVDSLGANYRIVWALSKYFPNVKTFGKGWSYRCCPRDLGTKSSTSCYGSRSKTYQSHPSA
ncbi:hypothetical protein DEO72_LG8g1163 [Vigna unguiculata]|uniref:Uncharacterized protein n=1 Tax=Vigna unguiculata TaxID=3917 RepID=A0A4D6MRC7_VIGUN|nr:hypothetical protein DEO72_LG8g1163 [Vigna unguiculata]